MGEYDKYICTTLQKRHMLPGPTPEQRDKLAAMGKRISMEHVHWIDEEVDSCLSVYNLLVIYKIKMESINIIEWVNRV